MNIDSTDIPAGFDLPGGGDVARHGRRRFLVGAGALAGVSAVGAVAPAGVAEASVPRGAGQLVILPRGVRLADTRDRHRSKYASTFRFDRSTHITVKVGGSAGVPADATAVVLTVTAVNGPESSHVTVYPAGEDIPTASNLNPTPGAVNANLVTVKLGDGGWVGVSSHAPGDKIVDVLAYYQRVSGPVREGRYISRTSPIRVHDSRPHAVGAGSFTTIDVTSAVPRDASAVLINLTVAATHGPGHFTAMPYDVQGQPSTSSVNATAAGDVRAASVIVPITEVGGRRLIKIYSHVGTFLIVDVFGWYTSEDSAESADGLFVPTSPRRLVDTRRNGFGRLWPNWVVEVPVPESIRLNASAVALNVTGVLSRAAGHFTVSAARLAVPYTSNVNWTQRRAVVPNHVVSRVSRTHGFQVFSSHGAHVLADMAGWFTGTPASPQVRYVNPPPPAAPPNWTLRVPRFDGRFGGEFASTVMAGDPDHVTDAGHTWHWAGTGYLGQAGAHVSAFGHRTEAGGPYRWLHEVQPNDVIMVYSHDRPELDDNREFVYRMVRRDVVWGPDRNGPPVDSILGHTRLHPGPTFSIIVCSRIDTLPTSLNHRLIVTFELVSWRDIGP